MREIDVREAQKQLAALLDAVACGEDVTITREGRPVAKLVHHDAAIGQARAAAAAQRIREMRKGVTLGGLEIGGLIEKGRL